MNRISDPDVLSFEGNTRRFSGFADLYDQYRAPPPAALAPLLAAFGARPDLPLVVDLGCGTGLSTRYWAEHAGRVIGIEPTRDMRERAQRTASRTNITYQDGYSHATGLPDRCATIVCCSQALHWMAPQPTFAEAARILVPGGVFAACDYDWPPVTGHWLADAAFERCLNNIRALEAQHRVGERLQQWSKHEHLARMQDSGCFAFVREALLHHADSGNGERLVGLILSQGSTMDLLKRGLSEHELGIDELRRVATEVLGTQARPWYWSARIRMAVVSA